MVKILILLGMLSFLVVSNPVQANSFLKIDAPEFSQRLVLVEDVLGLDAPQLIVGGNGFVEVYSNDQKVAEIQDFPGMVTSLAIGDVTGNFRSELLIGTDNAGAFYVYEYRNQRFQRVSTPKYLWSPVKSMTVADVNGDGWGDILALTQKGEAVLFISWEGEFYPFWRTDSTEKVAHLLGADLNGDGSDEIIYARTAGYVGVLQWHDYQLEVLWENFPWGTMEGLMVANTTSPQHPDILAITDQKIVYGWQWNGTNLVLDKHFPASQLGRIHQYLPDHGLASFSQARGLSLYRVRANELEQMWNLPHIVGNRIQLYNGDYLVGDQEQREYFWLSEVDSDYFQFYLNGELLDKPLDIYWDQGELLLAWDRLGELLDIAGFHWATVVAGKAEVLWGSMVFPLSREVVEHEGTLYAPIDALYIFGWEAVLDPARRSLELIPDWGYW